MGEKDDEGWAGGTYGVCPDCGRHDGYVNTGRGLWWGVCAKDEVRWRIEEKVCLFWEGASEADWGQNWEKIGSYREVDPFRIMDADDSDDSEIPF
jgi:hypothetical protein